MKQLLIILNATFKENYRNRFFVTVVFLGVGFFILSLLLGEMSFEEQQKILFDLGTSGLHWVMLLISVFMGSFTMHRELEKQTYMTLLSSPMSRTQFVLGKFFGLWMLLKLTVIFLAFILYLLLGQISFLFYCTVIYGILLEGLVLLAFSFLFALLLSPTIGILCSFTIFLMGHWLEDLHFFANRSSLDIYRWFSQFMNLVIPHFYELNWRFLHLANKGIALNRVLLATLHSVIWTALVLILVHFVFRRKVLS